MCHVKGHADVAIALLVGVTGEGLETNFAGANVGRTARQSESDSTLAYMCTTPLPTEAGTPLIRTREGDILDILYDAFFVYKSPR